MKRRLTVLAVMCFLLLLSANAQSDPRLDQALKELTETAYGNDLEDLDDEEIRDVARNIKYTADEIGNSDRNARRHIIREHRNGNSSRRHIAKCPYCLTAAEEIADGTSLEPPESRIPECFIINGAYYYTSGWGTLHRIYPNGQTGPAEGVLWFSNGKFIGSGYNGVNLQARPTDC